MLAIKLSKIGKTNKKVFRVIISEKGRDPYGNALEILGSYNQYAKDLQVKADRIKYWISKGAQMTPTVNNLLISHKIIDGAKMSASKAAKTSEKRLSQIKAKADKKAAREEAAKAPAPEANPEEASPEAPAETPEVQTEA